MGYTRYWERTDKKIDEDFITAVNDIISDCNKRGIRIGDWDGNGEPTVTLDRIAINGDARYDLNHETLSFDNNKTGFDFCKTARKPYDYAVRKILSYAKKNGFVKKVCSDGANNDIISDEEYLKGCGR